MTEKDGKLSAVETGSIHDIILRVLLKSQKPMKVREITKKVLELKKIKSKTPTNTISSILQRSIFVKAQSGHGYYSIIKKPVFRY